MQTAITQDKQHAPTPANREALARMFIEAFPALDAGSQRLAMTLYRLLAEGGAVSPTSLANALDRPVDDVQGTLGQWPGVFYDDKGSIVGFWGLSVKEMKHRVHVNGNTVYGWCAWDTLFLPGLLGVSVAVISHCAQTGEPVRLTVSPAHIDSVEPASVVLSFLKPNEHELRENVTMNFCHFVHFLRDREAGERNALPRRVTATIGVAARIGI